MKKKKKLDFGGKLPKPFVQSNAYATSATHDADLYNLNNFSSLSSPEQRLLKDKIGAKNPSTPSLGGAEIASIINISGALLNRLLPQDEYKLPNTPLETYNPHPYGMGSQAIMEKGGKLSAWKAKEMLKDGTANGKKLTKKQKRYFGMVAAGKAAAGMELIGDPPTGDPSYDDRGFMNLINAVSYSVMDGGMPMKHEYGNYITNYKDKGGLNRKLIDSIIAYNSTDNHSKGMDRINSFYNTKSADPQVEEFRQKARTFGKGPVAAYWDAPDIWNSKDKSLAKYKKGGSISQESHNPYDGGTMKFIGNSHADGGIDIAYGGKQVEVEGDETAFTDDDNTLHIMGNMEIPGTKTKFKNAVKAIAEKEQEYQKIKDKATLILNTTSPLDKFDKLKVMTGKVMLEGADQGQKDLVNKKRNLAQLQRMMLLTDTPEKAAYGASITGDPIKDIIAAIAKAESGNNYNAKSKEGSTAYGKYQMIKALRKDLYNKYFADEYSSFNEFDKAFKEIPRVQDEAMFHRAEELNKKYNGDLKKIVLAHRLGEQGAENALRNPELLNKSISTSGGSGRETPNQYLKKIIPSVVTNAPAPTIPTRKPQVDVPWVDIGLPNNPLTYKPPTPVTPETVTPSDLTPIIPPNRQPLPSNITPLSLGQVLPEIYAFGMNNQEPVQAKQYFPNLFSPYQVSFQDRLNENQATFNSLRRGINSPTALGSLAAQKYQADTGVLGEEFRVNQGISNEVINKNVALLNDAQLKNLGIADQQYVRQETAKAKTQAQDQLILNSLSSKYLQHSLENKRLAAYENLYDYRFIDTDQDSIPDQAKYLGPDAQFNWNGMANQSNQFERRRTEYDANGNLKRTTVVSPSEIERQQKLIDLENKRYKTPLTRLRKLF